MRAPTGVLFLCVANSARSQMAEGLARQLAPSTVRIYSAGSSPSRVDPHALEAMGELGLDISSHRSKAVTDVPFEEVQLVVTLCAEEVCPPLLVGMRHLHWPLADPAAAQGSQREVLASFRHTRDLLRERIERLFDDPAVFPAHQAVANRRS